MEISSICKAAVWSSMYSCLIISCAFFTKEGESAKSSWEAMRTLRRTSGLFTLGAWRMLGTSLSFSDRKRTSRKSRHEIRKDSSSAESLAVSDGQKYTFRSLESLSRTLFSKAVTIYLLFLSPSPGAQQAPIISSNSLILFLLILLIWAIYQWLDSSQPEKDSTLNLV